MSRTDPNAVAVDSGGTFTDFVYRDRSGKLRTYKRLSTPDDPSRAILEGLDRLDELQPARIAHGTTVATNAVLERTGAEIAFVATYGFSDLLFLRRQNRPELYELNVQLPPALVRREHCFGLRHRIGPEGEVLEQLSDSEIERVVEAVSERSIDAVAICLLHSYCNPEHEKRLQAALEAACPSMHVTRSSALLKEFREYERSCTTAMNAYLGPLMRGYLSYLDDKVEAEQIEVFQSGGGRCSLQFASEFPVHTVLSGPAGGVKGAGDIARQLGIERAITLDMGGTSTDVSLWTGQLSLTRETTVGGLPVALQFVEIETIGAGGGSIAYLDEGDALRVGPRSAGARPGPACYGRGGDKPTVTDAHLCLNRIRPDSFLGGDFALDPEAGRSAVESIAGPLGLSVREASAAILDIADASMARAMKIMALNRGFDPRDFSLVVFGGAGALHACRLAERLEIGEVVVPKSPGLLSAYGMLVSPREYRASVSVLEPLESLLTEADGQRTLQRLLGQTAREAMPSQRTRAEWRVQFSVDLRYVGQSFELEVPVDWTPGADELSDPSERFHREHERLYGYRDTQNPVELVTVRVTVTETGRKGPTRETRSPEGPVTKAEPVFYGKQKVGFAAESARAGLVRRSALEEGTWFEGPAIVTEYSSTVVVPPDWRVEVRRGHLVLRQGKPNSTAAYG